MRVFGVRSFASLAEDPRAARAAETRHHDGHVLEPWRQADGPYVSKLFVNGWSSCRAP